MALLKESIDFIRQNCKNKTIKELVNLTNETKNDIWRLVYKEELEVKNRKYGKRFRENREV